MLSLTGKTGGAYFSVECKACGMSVTFTNLRMDNGVPYVTAECAACSEHHDFKLRPALLD